MLSCSKCGKEFVSNTRSHKKFCSKKCRYEAHSEFLSKPKTCRRCPAQIQSGVVCLSCKKPSKWSSFDELRKDGSRKTRMLAEQSHRHCEVCSGTTWLSQPIPLELDHIDGNPSNSDRANLRLICPNCHAFTPTYRGRNIGRSGQTDRARRLKKYGSYR